MDNLNFNGQLVNLSNVICQCYRQTDTQDHRMDVARARGPKLGWWPPQTLHPGPTFIMTIYMILQNNVNMLDHTSRDQQNCLHWWRQLEVSGKIFFVIFWQKMSAHNSPKNVLTVKVQVSNWIPHKQEGNTNTAVWQSSNVTVQYLRL